LKVDGHGFTLQKMAKPHHILSILLLVAAILVRMVSPYVVARTRSQTLHSYHYQQVNVVQAHQVNPRQVPPLHKRAEKIERFSPEIHCAFVLAFAPKGQPFPFRSPVPRRRPPC
jgi:hypothetical protein